MASTAPRRSRCFATCCAGWSLLRGPLRCGDRLVEECDARLRDVATTRVDGDRVSGAFEEERRDRSAQPRRELVGVADRDETVRHGVRDERRAADLAEP